MENQKGITLIALVITIIVLLILAGVAIAMLSGDNGILNKANESAEDTAVGAAKEAVMLEINDAFTEYYDKVHVQNATTTIAAEVDARLDTLTGYDKNHTTITYDGKLGDETPAQATVTITYKGKKTTTYTATVSTDGKLGEWSTGE